MCGLVGAAGNLYAQDVTAFNELLYCDFLRGRHATGVASVRGDAVALIKRAWEPLSLMSHKGYDTVVSVTADVLIGHNRHGTMGDNNNHNNAHPFNFKNVVGAHNGTLERSCLRSLHEWYKYDTDSEALYSEISENGVETALNKVGGAWALSFFDRKNKTINLIRNKERPLFFAYKKDRSVLYWASENELLSWVLGRNKIELENDTVYVLPVDTLFTWKVGKKLDDPVQLPLASTYEPPWQSGKMRWDSKAHDWVPKDEKESSVEPPFGKVTYLPSTGKSTTTTDTAGVAGAVEVKPEDIILGKEFRPPYRDHTGQIVGRPRFRRIMDTNCCCFCGRDDVEWGDPVLFLRPKGHRAIAEFLCSECLTDPERVELAKAC